MLINIDSLLKVQAVQDHEKLLRARIKAREAPLALVAALKKGEGLDLPCPQVVLELPFVDKEWLILNQLRSGGGHNP